MERRDVAGTQHDRLAARAVDDGGFDADRARPAVEDQRYLPAEFLAHVFGAGRADAPEAVGRRRGDAGMFAGSGGKAAQQFERDRVAGNAQADRVLAAGHGRRHPGLLFQDQRQRAGPESFHQFPGDVGNLLGPAVDRIMAGEMDDQRVIGGPALGGEDAGDGIGIGGIRPEAVDRFGREGDQFTRAQQFDGAAVVGFGRNHWSRMPIAARAASATACTPAASVPITVKWPILRPGRAWCLP